MKFLLILSFALSLASCTLYESEGREAIANNKNGILTILGFNPEKSLYYTCFQASSSPTELSGPLKVIETAYESQGFSSYLVESGQQNIVLVYEIIKSESKAEEHNFCRIKLLKAPSLELSLEAIDLGVFQLLNPNTRP